ncbi:MAG: glycosyltransferase [Microgenomates group bacterium]
MKDTWEKLFKKIDHIEGWLVPGQERVLYDLASRLKIGSTIVEIGSFKGRSTACLGLGANKSTTVYAIDTFAGNDKDFFLGNQYQGERQYLDAFKKNVEWVDLKNVVPIQSLSSTIGRRWRLPIDLLFIDGSHIYEDVRSDFELFFPHVKPGGMVLFHDVDPAFPGVYKVWHELAKNKLSRLGNFRTLYFGNKPEPHTVFVILPVHNRLEYTKKCLSSLEKQRHKNFEVIIVDDGSTDGTREYLTEKYLWTIISGSGNWWWTKSVSHGVNEALKRARKGDFILMMNNDCYFKSNYLINAIKASQDNKRAIVGSLVLDADHHQRVVDAGVKISWKHNLVYGIADKIAKDVKFYRDREVIRGIDTLPGKGTLIPVEVFKKIGNFNYYRLPHYLADYEFFCRAKRSGFSLIISNKVRNYNFAKETSTDNTMFGRKSKSNILDRINFILLSCPKRYRWKNVGRVLSRLTFPYKFRLWIHNTKIKISMMLNMLKQRPLLVVYRQFPIVARIRLGMYRTIIKIQQVRQNPLLAKIFRALSRSS